MERPTYDREYKVYATSQDEADAFVRRLDATGHWWGDDRLNKDGKLDSYRVEHPTFTTLKAGSTNYEILVFQILPAGIVDCWSHRYTMDDLKSYDPDAIPISEFKINGRGGGGGGGGGANTMARRMFRSPNQVKTSFRRR